MLHDVDNGLAMDPKTSPQKTLPNGGPLPLHGVDSGVKTDPKTLRNVGPWLDCFDVSL